MERSSAGEDASFPIEAPPSSLIAAFDKKKNQIFDRLEAARLRGGETGTATASASVTIGQETTEVRVKNEADL